MTTINKSRSILPLPEISRSYQMQNEANDETNINHNWLQEVAEKRKELEAFSSNVCYRRYSTDEILEATNNFSIMLKIGEGGYGPLFKSTLDNTLVATKTLRSDVNQGMKQFHKEVEVLSFIRYPNMVLLMGSFPEYGCLVYDNMSNGILASSATLALRRSWQLHFKIAAEIATGLLFLHQTKPEPFVHRDLKPGNILLDHTFVSKIADVSLARLIPPSMAGTTQYHMTSCWNFLLH